MQTQEPGSRGLVDLEEMAQVSPAVTLANIAGTRSVDGAPVFTVNKSGLVNVIYDGTSRRAWISLQVIFFITVLVLALPAGRRRREIEDAELA